MGKLFTVLWGIYGLVWISLEGSLGRVLLMGVWTTLLLVKHAGKQWHVGQWGLVKWGVGGGIAGILTIPITILFMVLKTGLHAHGAEFTGDEIGWVVSQWWVWGGAGIIAGIGFYLLLVWQSGRFLK